MEDRSLDDFLPDDGDDHESEDGDGHEGEAEDAHDADDADPAVDADPAESTYRWTGEGAACAACGAAVERLWRDDRGLVCPDCKEW